MYVLKMLFQNGVLLRTVLDTVTGDLSDTRTRYLGSRPVKLFRITMQGSEAVSMGTRSVVLCDILHLTVMGLPMFPFSVKQTAANKNTQNL